MLMGVIAYESDTAIGGFKGVMQSWPQNAKSRPLPRVAKITSQ